MKQSEAGGVKFKRKQKSEPHFKNERLRTKKENKSTQTSIKYEGEF